MEARLSRIGSWLENEFNNFNNYKEKKIEKKK